jgi:hypothetical protein
MCFLTRRGYNKTPFLRVPFREVYMVNHSVRFYLIPPKVIANIFGNWLNGVDPRFKVLIRVGAVVVIWSLWLCRNDKVFDNKNSSLMQVIYRCTTLLCLWSSIQHLEDRDLFTPLRRFLHGWRKQPMILLPNMNGYITAGFCLLRLSLSSHGHSAIMSFFGCVFRS